MTIEQISSHIRLQLKEIYPETEIESFIRIIFKEYMNLSPAEIHLSKNKEIPSLPELQIMDDVEELKGYKPIQYMFGKTEFYGLQLEVNPDVLIPRPETEELVNWIINDYDIDADLKIADFCTGSGCIAIALKSHFKNAEVWANDVSKEALTVARRNARKNHTKIYFRMKDLLKGSLNSMTDNSLDIVVSNPPYVTHSEKEWMSPNVLNYEPHCALFAPKKNPLIFFKRISYFAKKKLKNNGKIFFEINETSRNEIEKILKKYSFSEISSRKDINGKWRMISAKKTERRKR